jgi:hypothetical protein
LHAAHAASASEAMIELQGRDMVGKGRPWRWWSQPRVSTGPRLATRQHSAPLKRGHGQCGSKL